MGLDWLQHEPEVDDYGEEAEPGGTGRGIRRFDGQAHRDFVGRCGGIDGSGCISHDCLTRYPPVSCHQWPEAGLWIH